jgi:hypothetical protein
MLKKTHFSNLMFNQNKQNNYWPRGKSRMKLGARPFRQLDILSHRQFFTERSQCIGAMPLSITTFSLLTRSIKTYFVTLSITIWHYAECHDLFIVTLTAIMRSVVMLNVGMLSVVAPIYLFCVGRGVWRCVFVDLWMGMGTIDVICIIK